MDMIKKSFFTLLTVALCGCASMSEEECRNADWRMIGLEDGSRGLSSLTLANHRKACAKVNVTPDLAAYEAGHREGMQRYCVYPSGLELGKRGAGVNNECPSTATGFFDGYEFGHRIYEAGARVHELDSKIQETQGLIDSLNTQIAAAEDSLVAAEGDKRSRREVLDSLQGLRDELQIRTEELSHLEYAYHRAERRYQALLSQ